MYNIKTQNTNIENYKNDIFNYNQRLKLEKKNLLQFIAWAEAQAELLKSLDGKRADKRLIKKLEESTGDFAYFVVEDKYATITADFYVFFRDRVTTGREHTYNYDTEKYELTTQKNNYLTSSQYSHYLSLTKTEKYNNVFYYADFLKDIERIKKHIVYIDEQLKNQTSKLKKAIKLNNQLVDLLYGNDFVKSMFNM